MPSKKLSDLCPEMRVLAENFKMACLEAGIDILIYETYRSNAEQDANYAKGRTEKGKIITNAKGGQSKHNCVDANGNPASRVFDCVPMRGRTCQWNDVSTYEEMGVIGRGLGLVWGGDWKMKDRVHFELKA